MNGRRSPSHPGGRPANFRRLREQGLLSDALALYRPTAEKEHLPSMEDTAAILEQTGPTDEALAWYERAAMKGAPRARKEARRLRRAARAAQASMAEQEAAAVQKPKASQGAAADPPSPSELARTHERNGRPAGGP
ncbi:hypothetical protein F7Q99_33720 [Streptomyces kaniharaensis]|uniref:Tetratricopeptide repeat protein n=1 Tax=Streptomyces kaniharaensis TaxID=212423 RepID=A0A6N7L2Q4_9ACTN|nr:hypothetical protein [Streptomyces kaniharaensis]MQS17017.1 hypothetical protein [Streptomyces kaniharaensis]